MAVNLAKISSLDDEDDDNSTDTSTVPLCGLCFKADAKFTCPRCNVPYCSLACYQSSKHTQCSEGFYRDNVIEEIQSQVPDPQVRKQMLESLKRLQEDDNLLDSDDEDDPLSLAERIKGINLDNADAVWDRLIEEEKEEFRRLVASGDIGNFVEKWNPWWNYQKKKKPVEEIGSSSGDVDFREQCPKIHSKIIPFSQLSKHVPPDAMKFNVMNALFAYTYLLQFFNGDIDDHVKEIATGIFKLCGSFSKQQNFSSAEEAIAFASQAVTQVSWLVVNKDFVDMVCKDVQKVIEGPCEEDNNYYIMAALSDMHRIFILEQKLTETLEEGAVSKDTFSYQFPQPPFANISKRDSFLTAKKLEFYISWAESHGGDMHPTSC